MSLIRMSNHHQYETSRDYDRLWSLLQETPVVCIVDCVGCRDIACTLHDWNITQVSVRGISYIDAREKDDFVRQCGELHLEWIVPNGAALAAGKE